MGFFTLFVFGLLVGSFINVLIDRLSFDRSIVSPPSYCDACKKRLNWYDLIPVVSFLVLGGRCRYCKKAISWQYPSVELLTAILFVGVYLIGIRNQELGIRNLITLGYHLFIIASFITIFFTDLKYGIIPDKVVFLAIGISFVYLIYVNLAGWTHETCEVGCRLVSALGAFLFFLVIYLVTRGRGMGFGDVKLSIFLGLLFGFPKVVYVLYIAFLTGAFVSIILILLGKKRLKETIAFGPFLVVASLLVLFFGDKLLNIWFLPG